MQRLVWIASVGFALAATPCKADDSFGAWEDVLATHELSGPDGEPIRVGDLQGDVVVVNFWASWCKPCRKELRVLNDWADDLAGERASIVAVSIDREASKAARFLDDAGLTLPLYHDGPDGLARALDLPSLPCTVVLDPSGRVVRVARDGSSQALLDLQRTVRSLLSESRDTETVPVGDAG